VVLNDFKSYGSGGNRTKQRRENHIRKGLELKRVLDAMADGDEFIFQAALLNPEVQKSTILYRQAVLQGCLKNPSVVRELYEIVVSTTNEIKRRSL
jgi:hypothetical protein